MKWNEPAKSKLDQTGIPSSRRGMRRYILMYPWLTLCSQQSASEPLFLCPRYPSARVKRGGGGGGQS